MFKSTLYFFFFCGLLGICNAQTQEINFSQSDDHIEIPGTQYVMVPPDDSFTISDKFHGLVGPNEFSAINITEMPMSFETVVPMFAKDMPNEDLKEEKDYMINGNNVKMYKTERLADPNNEDSMMNFWIMLHGNKKATFMLAATFESAKEKIYSSKFEKSLLSFMFLEDKDVDPQAGLQFSLDITNTPLKFASLVMQTGAAYNTTGDIMNKREDKTSYMVMVMPIEIEKGQQKDQAIRGVKRNFDDNITIAEVNPIKLDGIEGYEVVAYEEDETKGKTLKYAVALFDSGKYFDIRATSEIDLDKRLEMFKNISRSFKLK